MFPFVDSGKLLDGLEESNEAETASHLSNKYNYLPVCTAGKIPITSSGAFIKFSYFDANNEKARLKLIKRVENYFTLKTLPIMGPPKQSKRCKVDKKKQRIVVPRMGVFEILDSKYGLQGYGTKCQIKEGHDIDVKWEGSLLPNQVCVCDWLTNNIFTDDNKKAGSAGCILNLPAGQGKSFVAAYYIGIFKKKTAIIVHSTAIITQWAKVLAIVYPTAKIGYYYGKKKIDGDIIILVINSVLSDEFTFKSDVSVTMSPMDYFNQFGYIIYDECHLYANKSFGKAFKVAQAPYVFGLSATPDSNANNFDPIYWWELGPVVVAEKIPGFQMDEVKFTGEVHRINYHGVGEHVKLIKNETTDMTSVVETITMICNDDDRNNTVVDAILECKNRGLNVFVFADRRNYLETLRGILTARNEESDIMTTDDEYARIVGGTKETEFKAAEEKARVIFTTYQYMGTGKSIVRMNGLVLATPRKSKMEQYIKRVFRLGSDTSITRHIYDIVDCKTVLRSQWYTRNKYYTEQGFDVTETNVGPGYSSKKPMKKNKTPKKTPVSVKRNEIKVSSEYNDVVDKLIAKLSS